MRVGDPGRRLASCGLPDAWQGALAWTVLDTDFAEGQQFLTTLSSWQKDSNRPQVLHYVGICERPVRSEVATKIPGTTGASAGLPWIDAFTHQGQPNGWHLDPGFHRIAIEQGQVLLTLCVGSTLEILKESNFQADTVFLNAPADPWEARLLTRRCKPGARLCLGPHALDAAPGAELVVTMESLGCQWHAASPGKPLLSCTFNPSWKISTSRDTRHLESRRPGRCAVVGAGIAGASVAYALAQRGWQVTVIDQEAAPAAGASSLPAGLMVPHVSADDSPRSRLSRHGTRLMTDLAHRLLVQGEDWAPSGVLQQRAGSAPRWHPEAGWIKPASMVRAMLKHANISFVGLSSVHALQPSDGYWQLGCHDGQVLGNFALVVLANAMGCAKLLQKMPLSPDISQNLKHKLASLQAVHGSVHHGRYAEPIPGVPTTPVNGHGYLIPHLPDSGGEQWLVGSTFETDALKAADLGQQRLENLAHLPQLLPQTGELLAHTLERGQMSHWSATRCVPHDRLPLVGPIDSVTHPGLWLCVGMGARGLSLSALCAELLAARVGTEPWPVEARLARSLDLHRSKKTKRTSSGDSTRYDSVTPAATDLSPVAE